MKPIGALCAVFSLSVVQSCSAIALKLDGNGRFNKSLISISNKVPFRSQVVSNLKNGFWTVKSSPSALSSIIRRRRSTGSSGYFFTIYSNKRSLELYLAWHLMGERALDINNVENNSEHPLRVTAFFTEDDHFIKVRANCTATVSDDDTIYLKDFPIWDDGLDPDYKRDDGFYTGFLPPIFFNLHSYKLSVVCTGDHMTGRASTAFKITGVNSNSRSSLPPSQVMDLAIHHTFLSDLTFRLTLTFTAVGAHWMNGTASRYIIRMCSTGKTNRTCHERLLPSTHIVAARSPVRFDIPNEWKFLFNNTFNIWITAENNNGQRGPMSSHFLIAQPVQMKPDSRFLMYNQPDKPNNTASNPSTSQSTTQTNTNQPSNVASHPSTSQSTTQTNSNQPSNVASHPSTSQSTTQTNTNQPSNIAGLPSTSQSTTQTNSNQPSNIADLPSTSQSTTQTNANQPSNVASNPSTSLLMTNPPSNMATKKFLASRNLPRVLLLVWTAWVLG